MDTKQLELWRSNFGTEYSQRNSLHPEQVRRLVRNWAAILKCTNSPYPQSVLEVGCNIGGNLVALSHLVNQLHGIEPNEFACKQAQDHPALQNAKIQVGDGFHLPYSDHAIDMVFTAGVLIHIAPDHLREMTNEIVRVAAKYIVCVEYFSPEPVAIPYRGMEGFLFKRDFGNFYLENYSSLSVIDWGFFWKRFDAMDNCNWWLFAK